MATCHCYASVVIHQYRIVDTDRRKSQTHRVKTIVRVLLAGLLGLGLAGCKGSAAAPPPAPATTAASQFGGTDLAWIEINIAMDEQLLPLLQIVPERSGSPAVQALAAQVKAFTDAELTELRALHDQAALPSVN